MSKRNSNRPVEIPMTDLGWSPESEEQKDEANGPDSHAAGTPGGGTASGGLAGTNSGRGDPDEALDGALGSGLLDNESEDEGGPPYGGEAGGAVGGTPAEKRARGGRRRGGLAPGSPRRGDSTIGSQPTKKGR